jgi:hypothetical protein
MTKQRSIYFSKLAETIADYFVMIRGIFGSLKSQQSPIHNYRKFEVIAG